MIRHKGTQNIETERLLLRKILPEDAEMVYKWMSDPEVCKYECWTPHPNTRFTRGYIIEVMGGYRSDKTYHWGIQLGDELIGSVCAVNVDDHSHKALLGYAIAKSYWNKGYTTEAVKAVIRYMLLEVGLNRLEATHSVNNPASGRVMQKAGMMLEGHAREYYYSNAGIQDSNLYAITKSSFSGSQAADKLTAD
jgi:ribosomal-protein-alanine N-acetyltransferase